MSEPKTDSETTLAPLIVIGPDKTGKSSLIDMLIRRDPVRISREQLIPNPESIASYLKRAKAAQHVKAWWTDSLLHTPEREIKYVVYDRFPHPEDFVYAGITETLDETDRTATWDRWHAMMDSTIGMLSVPIVLVFPNDVKAWKEKFKSEGDKYVEEKHLDLILDRYMEFLRHRTVTNTKALYTDWVEEEDVFQILEWWYHNTREYYIYVR